MNRYGLTRDVSEPIRREVRRRDGYGCVVCGCAIYDYEHFSPEYADAHEHNADGIILLCDGCHRKKGKFLSRETIARAAKNPRCKQKGFSWGPFDVGNSHPEIIIGELILRDVQIIIQVDDEVILEVLPPAELGGPFRINAKIRDRTGNVIMDINENEWRPSAFNWDVEVINNRIIIRSGRGDFALILKSEPPHRIVIERMEVIHRGARIFIHEKHGVLVERDGSRFYMSTAAVMTGSAVGIKIETGGIGVGYGGRLEVLGNSRYAEGALPSPFNVKGERRRNAECVCGSGRRFKHCHGAFTAVTNP